MRKGIAQLLLLMPIFIIIATIAGFYFYNQNKSTKSQTPLNSAEDEKDTDSVPKTDSKGRPLPSPYVISNFEKPYARNFNYGSPFDMNVNSYILYDLPHGWSCIGHEDTSPYGYKKVLIDCDGKQRDFVTGDYKLDVSEHDYEQSNGVYGSMEISLGDKLPPSEEYSKPEIHGDCCFKDFKIITIDGVKAYSYKPSSGKGYIIETYKNGLRLYIRLGVKLEEDVERYQAQIDQILKSIRFKPNPFLYEAENYISIKLPESYANLYIPEANINLLRLFSQKRADYSNWRFDEGLTGYVYSTYIHEPFEEKIRTTPKEPYHAGWPIKDFKKIKIDGSDAISFEYKADGVIKYYLIYNGELVWNFSFIGVNTEENRRNIELIMDSIKFK